MSYHTLAPNPLPYLLGQRELLPLASVSREVGTEAVLGSPSLSINSRKTSNGCPGSKTLPTTSETELATSRREDRKSAFTNQSDENPACPTGVGAAP